MTNKLISLFESIFCFFFLIVFCYMIQKTAEKNFFAIFILPLLFYFIYLIKKKKPKLPSVKKKIWFWLYGIIWTVSFILLFFFAFSLEPELSWDWKWVIDSAGNYILNREQPSTLYYARYPNNQFITYILILFFRIISFFHHSLSMADLKTASIIFSCLLTQLGVSFFYLSALALYDRKKAFFIGTAALFYTPLFLYALFAYTDTFSLPFAAILLYLFIKLYQAKNKKKRYLYCILIGLSAGIGEKFKLTILIIFAAIIISLFFEHQKFKEKMIQTGISALSLLLCIFIISMPVKNFFQISEEDSDKYEFPPYHWMMMSLNRTGGYDPDDVQFTAQFSSYEERKNQDIRIIKKRIEKYGVRKLMNHIFYTKLSRTWTNPALAGDDYINREPLHKDNFLSNLFRLNGKYYYYFYCYISLVHLLILSGCAFSAVKVFKKKNFNPVIFMCQLSIFGAAAFLCIWECNSRYLFTFIPMLLFTAFDGFRIPLPEKK